MDYETLNLKSYYGTMTSDFHIQTPQVVIHEVYGNAQAAKVIEASITDYRNLFGSTQKAKETK